MCRGPGGLSLTGKRDVRTAEPAEDEAASASNSGYISLLASVGSNTRMKKEAIDGGRRAEGCKWL